MNNTETKSYTLFAIFLHWLMAILILGQLMGGKIMMAIEPTPLKFELFQLHKSIGFMILFLSIVRLFWRLVNPPPNLPNEMSYVERLGAKISHIGFYILMIGTPLMGWALTAASTPRIETKIFDFISVPDILGIPRTESAEVVTKTLHEYMAYAIILLLFLHIGAALKHHFVNQDNVLRRMLPMLKGN